MLCVQCLAEPCTVLPGNQHTHTHTLCSGMRVTRAMHGVTPRVTGTPGERDRQTETDRVHLPYFCRYPREYHVGSFFLSFHYTFGRFGYPAPVFPSSAFTDFKGLPPLMYVCVYIYIYNMGRKKRCGVGVGECDHKGRNCSSTVEIIRFLVHIGKISSGQDSK